MLKYFLMVMLLFASLPAMAQSGAEQFGAELQSLNRTKITFSPRFKSDHEMFSMRILDPNRQLIGKVQDLKIDESGAIVKLVSEINRIGRTPNIIQSEAYEITFHEDISSFEIPLHYDGAQDVSPEALAAITPAAGGGHIFGLSAMIGAEVRSDSGRWLGTVKNVMFGENAKTIKALVLEDVPGARRYTEIALPFDQEQIKMVTDYGRVQFRVKPAAFIVTTNFAKKNR